MPINPTQMGDDFLSGMEAHFGQASTNPSACTKVADLATYVLGNAVGIGLPAWGVVGLTGEMAATSIGTTNEQAILFLGGAMQYIMDNWLGTALGGLLIPLIPQDCYDAGEAELETPPGDPQPMTILMTALVNQLNNVTITYDPITQLITGIS